MKKLIVCILCFCMLLSCCACGKTGDSGSGKKPTVSSKEESTDSSDKNDVSSNDESSSDVESTDDEKETNSSFDESVDGFFEGVTSLVATITKPRIPEGTVLFDGDYNNYYIVKPKIEHPGVVNMDATYFMEIFDPNNKKISIDDVVMTVNSDEVKIIGATIIVPYSVRKKDTPLIVTVQNKKDKKLEGRYRFKFQSFTVNPTFYDGFDIDDGRWDMSYNGQTFDDNKGGVWKDGLLTFTLNSPNERCMLATDDSFRQAYGCFTARMKMTARTCNANNTFWLFIPMGYSTNPELPVADTTGEIDVVEYWPGADIYACTLHYDGYGKYYKQIPKLIPIDRAYEDEFANWSVVWTPTDLYWYVDGELVHKLSGQSEGVYYGSAPMYMILQLNYMAQGNSFGFNPIDTFPQVMQVDYVEVYGLNF